MQVRVIKKIKGMARTVRDLYNRLPTAVRAAWTTAWLTFIGALLAIITGLLPLFADAISTREFDTFYDSLSIAASAAVAAASALAAGIVNGLYRWMRPISNSYVELQD